MMSKIDPKTKTFGKFLMEKGKAIQLIPLKFDAEILFVALKVVIAGVPGTSSYDFGFIRIRRPSHCTFLKSLLAINKRII